MPTMLPITKILCPVDFSDFSYQALDKAGELAAHFGAELFVLHVMQTLETPYSIAPYEGMISFDVTAYEKALREGAKHHLQEVIERQHPPGVELRPLLREGHAAQQIVEAAQAAEADLIVLSTHGLGGWRHLVFGSVAEKVIRLAHCPVLVTRVANPVANPVLLSQEE